MRACNLCINDGRRSRQFSTQPLFVLQLFVLQPDPWRNPKNKFSVPIATPH
jgi:hypothetical protein